MKRKIQQKDRIAGIKQNKEKFYALRGELLVRKIRKRHLWRIGLGQPSLLQKSIVKCFGVSSEYAGKEVFSSLLESCLSRRTHLLPKFGKALPERELVVSEFRKIDSWIWAQYEAFPGIDLAGKCEVMGWNLQWGSFCVADGWSSFYFGCCLGLDACREMVKEKERGKRKQGREFLSYMLWRWRLWKRGLLCFC